MQLALTPLQLGSIATDISSGRPLWGLLRANEYLDCNSSLHVALARQAFQIIQANPRYQNVADISLLLLQGKTLEQLPPDTRKRIHDIENPCTLEIAPNSSFQWRRVPYKIRKARLQQFRAA